MPRAVLVKPAADPCLLIVDRIAVGVTVGVIVDLAGRCPGVDDDETGVVVIKGVAHAVRSVLTEVGAVEIGGAESVAADHVSADSSP